MEKSPKIQNVKIAPDDPRLTKFKLFAELSREELSALLDHSQVQTVGDGECIISAGESGHCMYVILSGTVRVVVMAGGKEIGLAELSPGDFLGEISLVDDGPRSANVTTVGPCEFLCITRMTLGVLAGLQPSVAIHILAAIGRSLVARLRKSNEKYLVLLGHETT